MSPLRSLLVLAPVVFWPGAASAAAFIFPEPPPSGLRPCFTGLPPTVSCTLSSTHHETDIRVDLPTVTSSQTEIIGRGKVTAGGVITEAVFFDQTVPDAPGSSAVTAQYAPAAAAARAGAIALAAGRPFTAIIETGPTLVSSSTTTSAAVLVNSHQPVGGPVTTRVVTGDVGNGVDLWQVTAASNETISITNSTSIGPATILVGADQSGPTFIAAGTTNVNTNLHRETFFEDDYQATTTDAATIEFVANAIVQLIGTVHPAVQGEAENMSGDFLKRLASVQPGVIIAPGNEARINVVGAQPSGMKLDGGWIETYGRWSSTPAQGMIPGDRTLSGGVRAGLTATLSPTTNAGFAFDQGFGHVDVPDASESADAVHTQAGVSASVDLDLVTLDFAAVAGMGRATTSHGSAALGGISTGSYGFTTGGLRFEVGYRLDTDGWTVIPLAGGDLTAVHTDAFTESGGAALTVAASHAERVRARLGLAAGRSFLLDDGRVVDVSGSLRVIDILAGAQHSLPVTLAGAPMSLDGLSDGHYAAELGTAIALHLIPQAQLSFDATGGVTDTGQSALAVRVGFTGSF
jgi:uncharacterized protein with beta-barrel porin domain